MNPLSARPTTPFLHHVFPAGIEPVIATGFNYHSRETALHGVQRHGGIDLDVPRGTPVLAAADGWAVATFGELLTRLLDGTPRTQWSGLPGSLWLPA